MNRNEKINLLTRVLQGTADEETRQQLRMSKGPGAVVIIYKHHAPGPDDEVSFDHNGQEVTIPYRDIQAFTRFDPLTIFLLPAKDSMTDLH